MHIYTLYGLIILIDLVLTLSKNDFSQHYIIVAASSHIFKMLVCFLSFTRLIFFLISKKLGNYNETKHEFLKKKCMGHF